MIASKTKYVTTVVVRDPDTNGLVEIEIRKITSGDGVGGMVGIDGSFLEADVDDVRNPYGDSVLGIPDDEYNQFAAPVT